MANPWAVQYNLVDGRLYYPGDCYVSIISAPEDARTAKALIRNPTVMSITKGTVTAPSWIGGHRSLLMTLRPVWIKSRQTLMLRCQIQQANGIIEVKFLDMHLGLMALSPANKCEHPIPAPLELTASVMAASVMAPVASQHHVIGITVTHRNDESQFLSCTNCGRQLYQGDCCMPCAVAQAKREGYEVVIGGLPSTHHVMDDNEGSEQGRKA